MNLFIFLGIAFLCTFVFGHLLEKLRIPWIFAALLFGIALSLSNPFSSITQGAPFQFLSEMGLFLLLFLIGFELEIKQIMHMGRFIVKATILIELSEMFIIGTALHLIFSIPWALSFLVALSFATVGESILLPILEEFRLVKTKLGQAILGIATFDDIFEIMTLLAIVLLGPILIAPSLEKITNTPLLIQSFILLIGLLLFILLQVKKIKKEVTMMNIPNVATVLPLLLSIFFIFIGIDGSQNHNVGVLGALFAGIVVKNLLPSHFLEEVEPQIKTIVYGLFAPIFFISVGLDTDASYLFTHFWLIILFTILAKIAKIGMSYFVGRDELGAKPSIFMGVALGVRFSTSLVFLQILLMSNIISHELYSILIGTSILFKFIIPVMLSYLAKYWHLGTLPAETQG